jgi:hypothetical protein
MPSTDPIFNQPSNRDRLAEADAVRQGYGGAFDFFAVWNVIADYSRKERLLREPVKLNQLPAEIFWFGAKSATLGTVAAICLVGLRLLLFGLSWYLFDLDRDITNVVYLIAVTILTMQYFTLLANYLHYSDGITDQLVTINTSCVIGSVITVEVARIIGLIAAFICYPLIISTFSDSSNSLEMIQWIYAYFLNSPWKLALESCFFLLMIICGYGIIKLKREMLIEKAEFDLE